MKKVSSKIFLLNREDVAIFNSGIPFPGSHFVKIDVLSDVALIIVPVKWSFRRTKLQSTIAIKRPLIGKVLTVSIYCTTINVF